MKTLPYEGATSGQRALQQIQQTLQGLGCTSFGSMQNFDQGKLIVQFVYNGMQVHMEASMHGYAERWLKAHPYKPSMRKTKVTHEREANRVASFAVYSILRDWIKGQVMAIETGILSFEGAFLGQLMLPSGATVLQHVTSKNLLPKSGS